MLPSSLDLTPPLASQVIAGPATRPITPPVAMRDFGDSLATRRNIYDNALAAAQSIEPITDGKYTLKLANVGWADPERYTRKQRKDAVLRSETLARRLRGTWQLYDASTNTLLEESKQTIAALPYLSSMGTFTHRGNEYTVNHQNRLMPGVFARVKNNGELESHVNVLPGKGMSHRYFLDPARGLFKIRLGQAEMPLLPLLHTLGATDQDVRNAWGDDLYAENYKHLDSGGTVRKLAQRLLRKADQMADEGSIRQKLTEIIERMELDPEVTQRTLGRPFKNLNKDAILAATKKLLDVSRGQAEPDDRDHLAYQKLYGPEDLFAERLARDHSGIRRGLFKKVALSRSLKAIKPGALTPQVEQVLLGSGLAQALEEINPLEIFDKQSRITRLGEGGIPSLESIPEEARSVQPSHMGYLDPLRTPESMRAGVDLQFSRMARKGSDGRVYSSFYSPKSGKTEWKSPQDIVDATVTTSDVLSDPFWQGVKRVPVMRGGKIDYVEKKDVDYVVPNFENVFSPVGNLVPFKSMAKGQRTSMAARMLTQALPLVRGEAPLVRSGVPGGNGRSFEEEYSSHMGAVAADKGGRVVSVSPGAIGVVYDDGTKDEIDLYDHHPFNRKTFLHQTAMVQPGQSFKKGDLLARSNFTDDKGSMALGLNARVAYMPWEGYNFEDAIVISEAFAKRSASEHMYQHGVEVGPKHKLGKRNYVSLFPGTFDRKTLETLDDKGLVRPGTEVQFGDPLILAAKERDRSDNKIHKRRQAGFQDETVTWSHHDPGIVTDVVMGKHGPVVVVKSHASTQVGDKLSGRYGDKGVIAAIVPDHEMPVGEDGKPMEVLLSDNGTISRTNPSQHAEAQLGKIAAITGKPVVVPDFEDPNDQTAWVQQQLAKYGIKDMEDVTIPKYRTKTNVQTGNRFLMKLHHTSECFDDKTEALTARGWLPWPEVKDDDLLATVDCGHLVFEKPLSLVRQPFVGELCCFEGRYIDYAVTENHRLYLSYYHRKDRSYVFETAGSAHGRRFRVPQFGFPQLQTAADTGEQASIEIGGETVAYGDYAELLGWWASEGYAKVTPRSAYVAIYQSAAANPEHFAKIEALVKRLPFPWHYYRANGRKAGIVVSSRKLAEHLRQYGTKSNNKRLPRHLFDQPPDTLRRTYEAMMSGDGYVQPTPTGDTGRYTTVSKGLADDFQELCVRAGFGAVVRRGAERATIQMNLPDGRSYTSKCLPVWECGVAFKRTDAQVDGDRNAVGFSFRAYAGTVYCAEMRTGLLYVRRNGKPMLSGNSKVQARSSGAYGSDDTPAKGGETGSKRVSVLDTNALLSNGGVETLADARMTRGQKKEREWMQLMSGNTPQWAGVPVTFQKFVHQLRGAGVDVVEKGPKIQVMAMTNNRLREMTGDRVIKTGDTVSFDKELRPVPGGLFDLKLTGGHGGRLWSAIELPEPMPNPVMEEPIRRILGLTGKKFEAILGGTETLPGFGSGPKAIAKALDSLNLDREIAKAKQEWATSRGQKRDAASRRRMYLESAKRTEQHPRDWILDRAPVLPPMFRPVSVMGDKRVPLVSDPNYLYKELLDAGKNYHDVRKLVGEGDLGDERLAIYRSFKAVTGLADPVHPKLVEKNVKGLLKSVFGASPKFGSVQRKLISMTVDNVGRAGITPDPELDMDQIGVPENQAFQIYSRFIVRQLKRRGLPMREAVKHVLEKSPLARETLIKEMDQRPVFANRAPVLHKFGIMAFRPKLVSGDVLKIPPLVVKGFNADFDGDAMQFHVPTTDKAVREAYERLLPSKSLISPADFKTPMHAPGQDYLAGLWHMTRMKKQDPTKPRRARTFRNKADVLAAYARGDISHDTEVDILEP